MGDVFHALADPTRRLLLDELAQRDEQTLFELCGRLAMKHDVGLSRQAISQHLAVLEDAGLVSSRRVGRTKLHHLETAPLRDLADRWLASPPRRIIMSIRISVTSVFVDDQAKALAFYTDLLGFVVKNDVPVGEHRLLTVVSPDAPDGTELLLEPNAHPVARAYTAALVEDGIPAASFAVDDVRATHTELAARGIRFTQAPIEIGPVITAVLDDTCGNLVQLTSAA